MQRNAISALTHVFDALRFAAWCVADPGSMLAAMGPGSAEQRYTLHRVRDTETRPFRLAEIRAAFAPCRCGCHAAWSRRTKL